MTKGTTSARLSGGQQYEAGSPMHVLISPDDDRRAGACAPLTPGGEATGSGVKRIPVTQATVSTRVERSPTSGTSGRTRQTGTGFACGALPSGRRWSTALAVDTMKDIGGGCGRRQDRRSLR